MFHKVLLITGLILPFVLTSCSCKPQIKYVYIKQKCPTLHRVDIKDLNLSKQSKPLKLHIKVKDAQ